MIEPDQLDKKLAGGGSGPTICWADVAGDRCLEASVALATSLINDPAIFVLSFILEGALFIPASVAPVLDTISVILLESYLSAFIPAGYQPVKLTVVEVILARL